MKNTKKDYEEYLNEFGESLSEEEFIIGGKMRRGKYGSMMRKHDPVGFEVGYSEWVRDMQYRKDEEMRKIEERIKDFIPNQLRVFDLMKRQRKEINELVYDICMAVGEDGVIDLSNDEGDYDLMVVYDGGNHPEYASNICSTVYKVRADMLKNTFDNTQYKAFSLETEDCPDYDSSRLDFSDMDAVFDAVLVRIRNDKQ